ncbi:NUDIX hydrolase [Qipengyuania sp. GH1]|uniref:NUDIX hydrolase n=1 Tax=Qipengyuania aestuarii TaxID=2867241 RepID=UPI001C87B8E6|nr:NUDIX hydrolase [Qipengyuania aestuarii]MBX7534688.1 NUDIX hydrolase [Qipengyuania aestuarii]
MAADGDFSGAKIVLKREDRLLAYLRDDKSGIPFPGLWDLPGGGREAGETPAECAMREVEEEFGLHIPVGRIVWSRRYPSPFGGLASHFLVAHLLAGEIEQITFGSEGQRWRMMTVERFLTRKDAVPDLQTRLADYIAECGPSGP